MGVILVVLLLEYDSPTKIILSQKYIIEYTTRQWYLKIHFVFENSGTRLPIISPKRPDYSESRDASIGTSFSSQSALNPPKRAKISKVGMDLADRVPR
jgi:hypothetical protein